MKGRTNSLNIRILLIMLALISVMTGLLPHTAYAKTTTTITVTDMAGVKVGESIATRDIVKVTSGYDGTLQYDLPSGVTVSDGRFRFASAGVMTITVTAPETANFTSASKTFSITIMGKSLGMTTTDQSVSLGTGTLNLMNCISVPSDYTGEVIFTSTKRSVVTVSGTTATLVGEGTAKINVEAKAAGAYNGAKGSLSITVTSSTPQISVSSFSVSADAGSINLNDYVSVGSYPGTLSYSITSGGSYASVSGSMLTITGAGSVNITVTAPAAGGYSAASKNFTVTINPVTALTGFRPGSVQIGSTLDLSSMITTNSKFTGSITYSVISGPATVKGSILMPSASGDVKVSARTGATTIFGASDLTTTVTVTRRATNLTGSSVTKYRDDAALSLSSLYSISSGYDGTLSTSVSGSSISLSGNTIRITGIGTSTITLTAPQTERFEQAQATITVTVKRHETSLSASNLTKYKDDAAIALTDAVTVTGGYNGTLSANVEGSSVSVSGGMIRYNSMGTSTIHVTAPQTETYEGASADFTVTVLMRDTTLTTRDITLNGGTPSALLSSYYTLTGNPASPSFQITEGADVISITGQNVRAVKVGSARITVSVPENSGYSAASAVINVTVTGQSTTLTNKGEIKTEYGNAPIRLTDHVSVTSGYDGELQVRIDGNAVTYQNGSLTPVLAGSATVHVTAPATAWYGQAETSFTVSVQGKSPALSLKSSSVSADYGSDPFTISELFSTSSSYDGEVTAEVTGGRGIVTIRQGKIELTSAGSAEVTFTAKATQGYLSEQKTLTVTVRPISPKLKSTPAIALCRSEAVDLADFITYAEDSAQRPAFEITEGEEIASLKGSELSVEKLGKVRVSVTLPAAGQYAAENTVIEVTTVEVSFDNTKPADKGFYNGKRTAKIRVMGEDFDQEDYPEKILSSEGGKPETGKWEKDGETSVLTVSFPEDGTYTFHSTDEEKTPFERFVIDTRKPVVSISAEKDPENKTFYKDRTVITIRVTDANPKETKPEITGTADDRSVKAPEVKWEESEDGITAKITFETEGTYQIRMKAEDRAGNESEEVSFDEFTLDLTAPEVLIDGLEDGKIYRESLSPVITYTDAHLGDAPVRATISGTRHAEEVLGSTAEVSEDGGKILLSVKAGEQEADDVYTMKIVCTDLAGNSTEKTVRYGINCFGSDYTFDTPLEYLTGTESISVTEQNVSALTESSITLGCNGSTRTLTKDKDYTVEEMTENGMHLYRYTIRAEAMTKDGYYDVLLRSKDEAGNSQTNESKGCPVRFTVDRTAPDCIITNLADGGVYNEQEHVFTLRMSDNIALGRLTVYADDKEIARISGEEIEENGGKTEIHIGQSNSNQVIRIELTDAAGNTAGIEPMSVLVATNPFVRFFRNTPLLVITGFSITAIGVVSVFIWRKIRRK